MAVKIDFSLFYKNQKLGMSNWIFFPISLYFFHLENFIGTYTVIHIYFLCVFIHIFRQSVQFVSEHWQNLSEANQGILPALALQRLQVEYDAFFLRAVNFIHMSQRFDNSLCYIHVYNFIFSLHKSCSCVTLIHIVYLEVRRYILKSFIAVCWRICTTWLLDCKKIIQFNVSDKIQ